VCRADSVADSSGLRAGDLATLLEKNFSLKVKRVSRGGQAPHRRS